MAGMLYSDPAFSVWLGLAVAGFLVGLWLRPLVVVRAGMAAYWSGALLVGTLVLSAAALAGALLGRLVLRIVRGRPATPLRRRADNSLV
jgi:hypothetical protein